MTWPAIAGHQDYIMAQLAAGVTVATVHQLLRDERGLAVSVGTGGAALPPWWCHRRCDWPKAKAPND